jgi:hypothetical protein
MALDGYNRFVVRSTDLVCWLVVSLAAIMWVATVMDHFLRFGWGWHIQIIWIAPIIVGGAMITRLLARVIFRWMGALD